MIMYVTIYKANVGYTDKHHLGEKKETEDCNIDVKYILIFIISLKAPYPY